MGEEEFESGQQVSKEEMDRLMGRKPLKKRHIVQSSAQGSEVFDVPDVVEGEGFVERVVSPDEEDDMRRSEEEVSRRQVVEYREKVQNPPESSVEMDSKLIEIAAKMAVKKELMPAKDNAGIVRNIAIELEEDYPEPFTEDIVKGNFGDAERASVFGNISLINAMKSVGQAKDFSFIDACRFNKAQLDTIVNISRAKGGFSAILVKTDKHVSEGVVQHVQRAFMEKKEKKWGFF